MSDDDLIVKLARSTIRADLCDMMQAPVEKNAAEHERYDTQLWRQHRYHAWAAVTTLREMGALR